MIAYVPPVWVTWAATVWALCWSLWAAVDCWCHPRHALTLRVAHALHLLFCVQWAAFLTLQFLGVWSRAEYLEVVAPYAPVVFAFGPWSIWPIKHWFYRRSVRAETVTITTVSESGDVA